MAVFCARPEAKGIGHIFVSDERKARDGADMLHMRHGCSVKIDPRLGENERSATGYVAPPRFWKIVDRFFSEPETSVLGWERAVDTQARIKAAALDCIATHDDSVGDLCIISHGGFGTLLLCDLKGDPISRSYGQPVAGSGCFSPLMARHGCWSTVGATSCHNRLAATESGRTIAIRPERLETG